MAVRSYVLEAQYELVKHLRMPMYSVSTIVFPLMFYVFFGLGMGRHGGPGQMPMARYLLASYGAFGVMGAALYAMGFGLAMERGQGWLDLKRVSPMPMPAYFLAKVAVSMAFGASMLILLFTLGAVFGGVEMPAADWIRLGGSLVLGAIPFCAIGLAIGYFCGPNQAPLIVNMIYLPMAFCSGLWIPLQYLPKVLRDAAPALPAFHLSQIALGIVGAPMPGSAWVHAEWLAGATMLFAGLAWLGHRREQARV